MKPNKNNKNSIAKALSIYTQLSVTMAACIVIGFFIGKLLDSLFGTEPIFLFIFIIVGIVAAIKSMYSMVMNQFKS